jgi:hypothetical protein
MSLDIANGRRISLSFGTVALIFLTTFAVAAAGFLAEYALGGHQVTQLNGAGFLPWPDAGNLDMRESVWDQVSLIRPYSAWYKLDPFHSLSVAFIADPLTRASIAAGATIVAGIGALFCALLWNLVPVRARAGLAILPILGVPVAIGNVAQSPIASFKIDLGAGIVSNDALNPGDTMAMSPQTILGVDHHSQGFWRRRHSYYDGYAQNSGGQTLVLYKFGNAVSAGDFQQALMTFINSNGAQL